jgi:hypothetical protein
MAAPLHTTAIGTRPQPNSETTWDDEAERTESGSAGEEHDHPESEHECPESENERQDQDGGSGCI